MSITMYDISTIYFFLSFQMVEVAICKGPWMCRNYLLSVQNLNISHVLLFNESTNLLKKKGLHGDKKKFCSLKMGMGFGFQWLVGFLYS